MPREWGRSIVLTGASGGLGRVLAEDLAAPGVAMTLTGRDGARLEGAAEAARARGAAVVAVRADVRDRAAMARLVAEAEARAPLDLAIANAGVSAGSAPGRAGDPPGAMVEAMAVNVLGAANTVEPALGPMLARGRGRLVLVGSLAAVRPLPDLPAYSASKAALAAWAVALRGRLSGSGVGVTLVQPGFVTTPMSARHEGARPFEIAPEDAARRILRAVAADRAVASFPRRLAWLAWAGQRLPPRLSDRAIRPFAATVRPAAAPDGEAFP